MIRPYILIVSLLWLLLPLTSLAQEDELIDSLLGASDNQEGNVSDKLWQHGSIMYSKEQMEWVRSAIKSHKEGIPIDILLPDIFVTKKVEPEKETVEEDVVDQFFNKVEIDAPVFYLKSILFFETGEWTIWINDEKISLDDEHDTLEIINVTEKEVVLLWRNSNISNIFPGWRNVLFPIGDGKFLSNGKNLVVNSLNGDVSFILGVNQSLVTENMTIFEGEMQSGIVTHQHDGENVDEVEMTDKVIPNDINIDNIIENIDMPEQINTENMDKYLGNINMLKSILNSNF